uniref:Uncharacterized protein n=1 Tax=Romanomermis culicivorax TaxID=13658 RepID=A0A915I441_ROMCU
MSKLKRLKLNPLINLFKQTLPQLLIPTI